MSWTHPEERDHWILESLPPRMPGCSAMLFRRARHGRRAPGMRSHRGDLRRLRSRQSSSRRGGAPENAPSKVASDYYRFQLLTGCRGVEMHGHKLHQYPLIRVGDPTIEGAGCCCGIRRTGAITSCRWHPRCPA